jgi:heme/copper-type cytochrome/quinol oxidase subunit 2
MLVTTRTLWEVKVARAPKSGQENALFVTVVGRQCWLEFRHEENNRKKLPFTTANELHVPAGAGGIDRPVYLTLKSADVCHSF